MLPIAFRNRIQIVDSERQTRQFGNIVSVRDINNHETRKMLDIYLFVFLYLQLIVLRIACVP